MMRSLIERPFFASATATSAAVPVRDPSGSPLARSSALGTGTFFKSESVIGVAGAAAGGVCAGTPAVTARSTTIGNRMRFIPPSPFPYRVLQVRPIDKAQDAEQAHRKPHEDYRKTAAERGCHPEAHQTNKKATNRNDDTNQDHNLVPFPDEDSVSRVLPRLTLPANRNGDAEQQRGQGQQQDAAAGGEGSRQRHEGQKENEKSK